MALADQDKVARPEQTVDLSLQDAAALYDVTLGALRRRVTLGEVAAYKGQGVRGREWRVTASALTQAGYRLRATQPGSTDMVGMVGGFVTDGCPSEQRRWIC
jgi:hypothetical protein